MLEPTLFIDLFISIEGGKALKGSYQTILAIQLNRPASYYMLYIHRPTIRIDPREELILKLQRELKVLRNENVFLRQQLEFPQATSNPGERPSPSE